MPERAVERAVERAEDVVGHPRVHGGGAHQHAQAHAHLRRPGLLPLLHAPAPLPRPPDQLDAC
eukprot:4212007-Lingulodinium_polyedra.AAC.1